MPSSAVPAREPEEAASDANAVRLIVGRSTLVDIGQPISRVSLTKADVADALVTSPNQLLVHGKVPGAISMFVWNRGGNVKRYEIVVERDLEALNEQFRTLFPGENIQAHSNGKAVVLSGNVSRKEVTEKAIAVAAGYVEKKDDVVTLLQAQAGPPAQQVMLRVRFRRSQPQRDQRARLHVLHQPDWYREHDWPYCDAAGSGADVYRVAVVEGQQRLRFGRDERIRQDQFRRLPEPVLLQPEVRHRRADSRDAAARSVPEPGRAEPRGREWQRSELPRRW
jgi:hypothetical protein